MSAVEELHPASDHAREGVGPLQSMPTAAVLALVVAAAAELERRLAAGRPDPTPNDRATLAAPDTYLTAEEAGRIAGVATKTIYSWAVGQRWASRPTKRTLRISETGFRAWLASRR